MVKKHIPNFITQLNLLSGSVAVILAVEGRLLPAAVLVGLAAVFDFFDGFIARLLHVNSEIGKELDSLADVISFGLTPSVILFSLIRNNSALEPVSGILFYLPYAALLIAAFSALRLAKFNLDTRQTTSFLGLPTPANAMFIASLPLFTGSQALQNAGFISTLAGSIYFQLALIPVSCYLLVSEIPLFALKFASGFSFAANKLKYSLVIGSVIALIVFKWAGIPLIVVLYLLISAFAGKEKF